MASKKYLSLERLKEYDALIKSKIENGDFATLESAKSYADGLVTGGHNHDDRYYTETEVDALLDSHTHSYDDLTDKPFGETKEVVEILPETEATGVVDPTFGFGQVWEIATAPALVIGKTYTVIYNGVAYQCVGMTAPEGFTSDPDAVALGNFAIVGGTDTGEPFAILVMPTIGNIIAVDLTEAASVTISIRQEQTTITPLPVKYLPEGIAYAADVDEALTNKADANHNHDDKYDAKGAADIALASAKTYADSAATQVKNDLLNGAGSAYDTLKKLGELIDDNVDAIEALETVAASKANASDLTAHTGNKENPHSVTAAQVGARPDTWMPTAADVGAFAKSDGIGMNNGDPIVFPTSASGATRLRLYSGRDAAYDGGAGLILTNKNASSGTGSFTLTAHDGTNSAALSGTPSGALSWKGNAIYHAGNKPPVDTALSSTSTNPVQNKVINSALAGKAGTAAATQSAAGLMSAADKKKLDGIATGATANTGDITGVTAGTGLTGGGTSGSVTLSVSYGTTAGTACQGNDSRLSNARTPTAHNHAASEITSGALSVARGGTGHDFSDIPKGAVIRNSADGTGLWYVPTASGALYATGANVNPSFGTLPVAQGGTGVTSLTNLLKAMFPSTATATYIPVFGSNWGSAGYATPATLKTAMGAASTTTYNATVTTSWTASGEYFYQNITVTGITANDNPIVGVKTSTDNAANKLYSESLGKVIRIVTAANKITVYATEAISTAFPIQLKVVR